MGSRTRIPSLHQDIIISILLELPVRSLFQFKSTCKSWYCSINEPEFIKLHLHKSSADINRQILLFVTFDKLYLTPARIRSTKASHSVDSEVTLLDPPIPEFLNKVSPVLNACSCNGLVFMNNINFRMIL